MGILDVFKKKEERERYAEKAKRKEIVASAPEKKHPASKLSAADKINASKAASEVLRAPHVTEKSAFLSEEIKRGEASGGQYVFQISDRSNKPAVKRAVEEAYGVKVEKVRIIPSHKKTIFSRRRYGVKSEPKKAIVVLKKGEKIEFV